ncbi:MAG: hypothetical protein CSA38_00720 [Flavobacteriales bacterium]|nr:MAG: hypothetical protein CSA38_00720 [Flavobacteriales bacterium]
MKKLSILISMFAFLFLSSRRKDETGNITSENNPALTAKITLIRDAFTAKLNSLGFQTPNTPKIIIKNTPAIISYGPEGLTIPNWETLGTEEKNTFNSWASQTDKGFTGEAFFKKSFNWFFVVHELGHYVQNLKGTENGPSQYQTELTANKIAIAYWKEQDLDGLNAYMDWVNAILNVIPQPNGTSQEYYNAHYIAETANINFNGYFQFYFVQQAYLDIETLKLSDFLQP